MDYSRKIYNLTKNSVMVFPIIVNVLFAITAIAYTQAGVNLSPHWYALFGHSVAVAVIFVLLSFFFRFCAWHNILCFAMLFAISAEELSAEGLITAETSFYTSAALAAIGLTLAAIIRWKPFTRAYHVLLGIFRNGLTMDIVRRSPMKNILKWLRASKRSTK